MRFSLLVPLTLALSACNTPSGSDETGDPGTTTADTSDTAMPTTGDDETGPPDPTTPTGTDTGDTTGTPPEPDQGGWSIRDDVPHGRVGHAAILDEAGDRMIVYGGTANDTWALPLSGPHANEWSQLIVHGEHPPVHAYGSTLLTDSAVYDPAGQRMIVLVNPTPATATESPDIELWALSLVGAPKWQRIVAAGPAPGSEVQGGKVVLDRDGNRLFIVGGALEKSGVWSLSLTDTPTWSRFADTPPDDSGPFYADHSLLLDAERGQLVLFGGHARLQRMWGLSLTTGEWTLLDEGGLASGSYGVAATLDADNDRIVIFGGDQTQSVHLFSLTGHTWTETGAGSQGVWPQGASGVADPQRGRILYFSGAAYLPDGRQEALNTTWTFSLADLELAELLPATRRGVFDMRGRTAVWDPTRQTVVAFGGYAIGETWTHGLAAADGWTPTSAGAAPTQVGIAAIHDPVGDAIVAFGGYSFKDSDTLLRLRSTPGATWETLDVAGAPPARAQHVAVHDPDNLRMIVDGGVARDGDDPVALGDTWALSLDGTPEWTQLAPTGKPPPERHGHVAVHDPDGQRMIFYGGFTAWGDPLTDLWSLSLVGPPAWTRLIPGGASPGALRQGSAVFDRDGRRMIVLDLAAKLESAGARVFALELAGETPTWHRFCAPGLDVVELWGSPGTAPNAVLVDDGLFVTISGGAFRFDLNTEYCD